MRFIVEQWLLWLGCMVVSGAIFVPLHLRRVREFHQAFISSHNTRDLELNNSMVKGFGWTMLFSLIFAASWILLLISIVVHVIQYVRG